MHRFNLSQGGSRLVFVACSLTISLLASAQNLPGDNGDFQCFDAATARRYISDFNVNVRSFGGEELCDNNRETKMLLNDIFLIEKGVFGPRQEHLFNRDFIPVRNYYSWARSQTYGVRRGTGLPYATAYNSGGYFTMQDGWRILSTLGRVGTFLHEARHTAGYGHTPCQQGPYAGASLAGCDQRLADGGSHGVEMEYYARVQLMGENFHPIYAQMARLMLLGRGNFVFNDRPLTGKDGLLVHHTQGLTMLDSEADRASLEISIDVDPSWRLKRTSLGASFFKDARSYALDLETGSPELVQDEYSYYKLLLDQRLQGVVDMEEVDIGVRRHVVVLTSQGLHSYQFAQGSWSRPVAQPQVRELLSIAPDGTKGLFARLQSGEVRAVDPLNLQLTRSHGSLPEGVAAVAMWRNEVVWLLGDGQIVLARSKSPILSLRGHRGLQMINAPLYGLFSEL